EGVQGDLGMHGLAADLGDLRPAERNGLVDTWPEPPPSRMQDAHVCLVPARDHESNSVGGFRLPRQPSIEPVGLCNFELNSKWGRRWRTTWLHMPSVRRRECRSPPSQPLGPQRRPVSDGPSRSPRLIVKPRITTLAVRA